MHSRRPLPALALVMPRPQLPTRAALSHLPAPSPHTPRAATPSTPILFPKQLIASPRTSTDSWGSSNGNGEDDVHWEWKPEQTNLLIRTLDSLPGHLYTPFNGPVPPSNLLDKIARSVSQAQGPLDWPHSLRATRAKVVEIARARGKDRNKENMTIDEQDEDGVVEAPPGRQSNKPLYRQSSMDFLPSRDKGSGSVNRLSSRLQRTDRIIQAYHPYARPASRSPSPPMLTPRSEDGERCFPATPIFAPSIPHHSVRTRTSSNSLGSRPSEPLRRSASTTSTHSNPTPSSTLTRPINIGVLSPIKPGPATRAGLIRRSESYAAPLQPSLKRAPSFGASSIVSGAAPKQLVAEKQPQDPESDDEEKVRQKKVKRPRTRSTHSSAPGAPEKKREEKKAQAEKDVTGSKSVKSTSKSRPQQRVRSGSMFGADLPQPQPSSSLPTASPKDLSPSTTSNPPRRASASPPPSAAAGVKTLRRVKTTAFNLGSCPTARRISFGSLAVPAEEQARESGSGYSMPEAGSALGSAFQMS
ncbi:hypothetical protein JB92DRAFT_1079806 [Gautieria morchelliformis]|nr:hypothetical protein JB92DRAFT_1079806 [Gautieria morchelliformis]